MIRITPYRLLFLIVPLMTISPTFSRIVVIPFAVLTFFQLLKITGYFKPNEHKTLPLNSELKAETFKIKKKKKLL